MQRCVFLGEDNLCTVHTVRPLQCATYPFWPVRQLNCCCRVFPWAAL